jgi:hypothetical protein
MVPMAQAAYLRIYLPERRGRAALEHVSGSTAAPVLTRGEFGLSAESSRDDAFVMDIDGRRFVCPRHPRLRMLEGLLAFRNAYEPSTASTLVPEAIAERAAAELDRIYQRHPDARSHILTSPFYVPLRWFAAFESSERELFDFEGSTSIRYRTRVSKATVRLRHTVTVLEEAGFDEVIVEQVADVLDWMRPFPGEGILELDYAGVASLFSDAELVLDESAADVVASIAALERGDFEAAGELYATAAGRWAHAHALAYAN